MSVLLNWELTGRVEWDGCAETSARSTSAFLHFLRNFERVRRVTRNWPMSAWAASVAYVPPVDECTMQT
jgi:hypothetical protein